MDIEQIILQSPVTGIVPDKLKKVLPNKLKEVYDLLGQIISPMYYELRVGDDWWIQELDGYVGKEEFSNGARIVWRREFPVPLPPLRSERNFIINSDGTFELISNGVEYLFRKADGKYLGHSRVRENY